MYTSTRLQLCCCRLNVGDVIKNAFLGQTDIFQHFATFYGIWTRKINEIPVIVVFILCLLFDLLEFPLYSLLFAIIRQAFSFQLFDCFLSVYFYPTYPEIYPHRLVLCLCWLSLRIIDLAVTFVSLFDVSIEICKQTLIFIAFWLPFHLSLISIFLRVLTRRNRQQQQQQ